MPMITETDRSVGALAGAQAGGQSPGSVLVVAVVPHRYDGTVYLPGQAYEMATHRVLANVQAGIVWAPSVARHADWWGRPKRVIAPEAAGAVEPMGRRSSAAALRIVMGVGYDPGSAVYRMHSAVNECTQHASALVRWGDTNPHASFRQYDGDADLSDVRELCWDADVLYNHVAYWLLNNTGLRPREGQILVRHYHGSRPDGRSWIERDLDCAMGALVFGARLSHVAEWDAIQWMPIAIPVARYRSLVPTERARTTFRVAHSPTKRAYKGTDAFLSACERLQRRHIPIEPVLIEGMPHEQALRLKATCDAVFDSFWLGIQGSGLEGAAMGLPVVAGDPDVRALYARHVGHVPYTYANTESELTVALEQLAVDPHYRAGEAARVSAYVREFHDYATVAHRFEQILATAMNRPEVITHDPAPTLAPTAPDPEAHAPKRPRTHRPARTVAR